MEHPIFCWNVLDVVGTVGTLEHKISQNISLFFNFFFKMEQIQKIRWQTNYNGKMGSNSLIQLDLLPKVQIPKKEYEGKVFQIEVADNSHPPILVNLLEIIPIQFYVKPIGDFLTLLSHGMTEPEYVDFFFKKHIEATDIKEIGVYVYKKLA